MLDTGVRNYNVDRFIIFGVIVRSNKLSGELFEPDLTLILSFRKSFAVNLHVIFFMCELDAVQPSLAEILWIRLVYL